MSTTMEPTSKKPQNDTEEIADLAQVLKELQSESQDQHRRTEELLEELETARQRWRINKFFGRITV